MSTPLTIQELFTPAPSGVGGNSNLPPPTGSWMAILLQIAATVGLPTTSWQPGQPERTILADVAVCLSQEDAIVSLMAQGGFLDFAANGTVTYVALNGQTVTAFVTPDPSVLSQNPAGSPGWLDLLASSVYDVTRLPATYGAGILSLVNTQPTAAGPFAAGQFHVANSVTHATYNNTQTLSIPSSLIAGSGGVITAVAPGTPTTTITTQTAHGQSPGDVVYLNGVQGINGINGQFAQVVSAPTSVTLVIQLSTTGAWTSGGTLYHCTQAPFQADLLGLGGNAATGSITTPVTQINGVGCFNVLGFSASNYESNASLANRCRLKLGALSPNGPAQAYVYFALTAQVLLAAETPVVQLTNGAIESAFTFSNPQTGIVETVVASSSPASSVLGGTITPGCTQLPITGTTNATPIVVTTASNHGLVTGNTATVEGVTGNFNANGTWTITVLSPTTFSLNNSVGNGAYTGGGVVEGGDLGQIDNLFQPNVVPDGVTAITVSALALPVAVVATVVVPQAFVQVYRAAVGPALDAYLKTLPIGGNLPPGATFGTVPISAVEGVLSDVGVITLGSTSYVRQITGLTVNGAGVDLVFPTETYRAIPGGYTITVIGV